jgi:hypothetical protein
VKRAAKPSALRAFLESNRPKNTAMATRFQGKKIPLNHKNVHFNKNKIPVRICVLYFQDGICNGSFRKRISQFQVKKLDTEYYHNKNHHKERIK